MKRFWGLFVLLIFILGAIGVAVVFGCLNTNDPQQCYAAWLTAIGTIFLAFVAIFQDGIRSWLLRPNLRVSYEHSPPFGHLTFWRSGVNPELQEPVYYF